MPVVRTVSAPLLALMVATAGLLETQVTVGTGPGKPLESVLETAKPVGSASAPSRSAGRGTVASAGAMASVVTSAAATTSAAVVVVGAGEGSVQALGKAAESVVPALAACARNSPATSGTAALEVKVTVPAAAQAKVARAVIFGALPSEKLAVAANCTVCPATAETEDGVTAIEVMLAAVTESEMLPEMIPEVAVMVAVPAVVPAVTRPEGETVRMFWSLEAQLTPESVGVLPSELLPVAVSARVAFIGRGGSCSVVPAAGVATPTGSTETLCRTGVPTPSEMAAESVPEVAVMAAVP